MEKYFHFDRNKALQELDGEYWNEPEFHSHLIETCYELRKKVIGNFEIEDLRIMIGQSLSLDFLIPLALEFLEDNIFSAGVYYCGDLLDAVLKVNNDFWEHNPIYRNDLEHIIKENVMSLESRLTLFRQRFI